MTGTGRKAERLPSRDECLRLLSERGCGEEVMEHCKAVSELAVKIARKCKADVRLVEIGSLLHDLGRCRSHSMVHAVEGAKLATELGLPKPIVNIIERHIGAGISADEAVRLGLPKRDYTPRTLEEKIVAHADNLMSGSSRTRIEDAVSHLARKGQHEVAMRMLRLHHELSEACGIDVDEIR